jgi:hypothetical protein
LLGEASGSQDAAVAPVSDTPFLRDFDSSLAAHLILQWAWGQMSFAMQKKGHTVNVLLRFVLKIKISRDGVLISGFEPMSHRYLQDAA